MVFTKKEEDYFLEHKDLWTKLLPYIEKMLKEEVHRTTIINNKIVNPDEEAIKKRDQDRETAKKKVEKLNLSDVERLKILLGLASALGDDDD
jgi:DNA-binding transcriptional regulator GbsR (MarR family)